MENLKIGGFYRVNDGMMKLIHASTDELVFSSERGLVSMRPENAQDIEFVSLGIEA